MINPAGLYLVENRNVFFISCEELLQDWNYRLRKPCGNNFEAAKPEEKKERSGNVAVCKHNPAGIAAI